MPTREKLLWFALAFATVVNAVSLAIRFGSSSSAESSSREADIVPVADGAVDGMADRDGSHGDPAINGNRPVSDVVIG